MGKHIEKFVRYMEIEKNFSSHTITNYKVDLEGFNKFISGAELEKIDYLMLRKYLAVLKEKNFGNRNIFLTTRNYLVIK